MSAGKKRDWTQDAHGRSNSSQDFLRVVDHVAEMLRHVHVGADVVNAARGIVAALAHGPYRLTPKAKRSQREPER